jgi:hypothetical protein
MKSMKRWLAERLQGILDDDMIFECDAVEVVDDEDTQLGDEETLDALKLEPTIFVKFRKGAVYSLTNPQDHFDSKYFESDYADFVNEQSNCTQVCALHFLMWHSKCLKDGHPRSFPTDNEAYADCILAVKKIQVAWGNSNPARWLDAALGPFELAKLFCKSFGSRLNQVTSFDELDAGSLFRMVNMCVFFSLQVQGLSLHTSREFVWAHRLWYNSWDSDTGILSIDDFSRIMLILSELFHNSQHAFKIFRDIVTNPNFSFFHLLKDQSSNFATHSEQSGVNTEWFYEPSRDGASTVQSEAPNFAEFDDGIEGNSGICNAAPDLASSFRSVDFENGMWSKMTEGPASTVKSEPNSIQNWTP